MNNIISYIYQWFNQVNIGDFVFVAKLVNCQLSYSATVSDTKSSSKQEHET